MDISLVYKGIIIGAALAAAAAAHFVFKAKDDNVVEELSEKVIEKETGVDIDLTPLSPEKKDVSNKSK